MSAAYSPRVDFGLRCLTMALRHKAHRMSRHEPPQLVAAAEYLVPEDAAAQVAAQNFAEDAREGLEGAGERLFLFAVGYSRGLGPAEACEIARSAATSPEWGLRKDCGHD